MKKFALAIMVTLLVFVVAETAFANWWGDPKPILREEYTEWGMLKKLELTQEQVKLVKLHQEMVAKEFHEGLFSILTKAQIEKREKLFEKREAWIKEQKAKMDEKLAAIEDEEEREKAKEKMIEDLEWEYFLREHFFAQEVRDIREEMRTTLRDNNEDPKPCMKQLDQLQNKIDQARAFYFPYEVRCRLNLSWLQHRAINERDRIRDENWESGLKDILTPEQYEYLKVLREERKNFYENQKNKFEKRLEEKMKEEGADWNPYRSKK